MSPKDIYALVPDPINYITLHIRGVFAYVIKLRILRSRNYQQYLLPQAEDNPCQFHLSTVPVHSSLWQKVLETQMIRKHQEVKT